MTDVKIRVATEADAAALARFRYELRSSSSEIEGEAEFIERCTVWMRERLRDNTRWQCWIAECDETTCGNVWAQLVEKIPNPAAETECYVYLTNFYVRAEHRGQGIGTLLLSEVLAWSKANNFGQGIGTLLLSEVLAWSKANNAHAVILWPRERSKTLYARHGFDAANDLMHVRAPRIFHAWFWRVKEFPTGARSFPASDKPIPSPAGSERMQRDVRQPTSRQAASLLRRSLPS